ncbi:MAG: AmmeMemoRadiSam system protein B [Pseudomonadota bacterium]
MGAAQPNAPAPEGVHPVTVAGVFFPADAASLETALAKCERKARRGVKRPFKALMVPHAGLSYSGAIAASAFNALETAPITRIVLLSPAHRLALKGWALPSGRAFATPLGDVPIDPEARKTALAMEGAHLNDRAFDQEHGVEVLLPFIKTRCPGAAVLPVLVGEANPDQTARLLAQLWGGPETLILISTDLSHFLTEGEAKRLDDTTLGLIDRLNAGALTPKHACGSRGLNALLTLSRALDLRPLRLDYTTSGDVTGNRARVVGYAAYGFEPARSAQLPAPVASDLLYAAQHTLGYGLRAGRLPKIKRDSFAMPLHGHGASFVTLTRAGRLRGCIGSYVPTRPLIDDVVHNAFKAAFGDPRFAPLTADELANLELSVSVLSTPRAFPAPDLQTVAGTLEPDRDGLILSGSGKRSIFLPSVWESLPKPEGFVATLMRKAGLDPAAWPNDMRAWRFSAEKVSQQEPLS